MDSAVDSVVRAEIAVEVGLRQRIINVLQSRLEYAQLLHTKIASADPTNHLGPGNLRKTTDECFETLEAPLIPLVYSKPPPKRPLPPQPSSQHRGTPVKTPLAKGKFLYIDMPSQDGQTKTFLLRCPTCSKTSFISLQGLLNHGRLVHKEEYATHDSCIAHCAIPFDRSLLPLDVINSVEEGGDVLALGTRIGSNTKGLRILPGLQRLFEIAVGVDGISMFPRLEPSQTISGQESGEGISTVVSKTLGHHVETPGLAPFLGRQAKRRGIATYEEDSAVDIDGMDQGRIAWKKPRRERGLDSEGGLSTQSVAESKQPERRSEGLTPEPEATSKIGNVNTAGSRFYNTVRIVLADWSMWLPPERDNPGTYIWMVTLDSPAYTTHHTAYMTSMKVSPPPSSCILPSTTRTYPFFVRGYTSQPFLARIELGLPEIDGLEQTMVLEHWIDVDTLKTGNPVMGDEQVVDLDLDRRIPLREPLKSLIRLRDKARFKSFWSPGDSSSLEAEGDKIQLVKMKTEEDWEYEKVLRSILPEFPMTLKDVKSGVVRPGTRRSVQAARVPKVPYRLTSTPKELLDLVHGKRKAIEWARAKAISEAYTDRTLNQAGSLPLTVGDVYRWLEDEGEFPRPVIQLARPTFQEIIVSAETRSEQDGETSTQGVEEGLFVYCSNCGMGISEHPHYQASAIAKAVKRDKDSEEKQKEGGQVENERFTCNILPPMTYNLPMVEVGAILRSTPSSVPHAPSPQINPLLLSPKLLLETVDPNLTLACLDITRQAKPNILVESNAGELAKRIAPCALLAHTLPFLVKTLIQRALSVAARDKEAMLEAHIAANKIKAENDITRPLRITKRLLTASHLLRGLMDHGQDETMSKLLVLLSPLGISPKFGDYSDDEEEDIERTEGHSINVGTG